MNDKENSLPTGMEISMLNPDFRKCPDKFYDQLRSQAPVYQDKGSDRVVLTRAREIGPFLNDRSFAVDPRKTRPTSILRKALGVTENYRPNLAFMDDPDHRRIRGLVAAEFSPTAVEALRPKITRIAEDLMDQVSPLTHFDVMEAYAKPLPTLTISMILGLSEQDQRTLKEWSDAVLLRFDPKISEEQRSALQLARSGLRDLFSEAIRKKREQSEDDLVSRLLKANRRGEIEEIEIIELCEFLLVAGNLTTTDLIGNAVHALLSNPAELLKLAENSDLASDVVEETLRFDPPVTSAIRVTTCPRNISGVQVEEGQSITALLMSANHDPELHPDPLRFDIERQNKKHYAFGGGSHFCIGAALARLEGEIAIPLLFRRFPTLKLSAHACPERRPIPSSSGWHEIWVQADPR